jgi:hypothetical protein
LIDVGFEMPPQVVGWAPTSFNPSTARLSWEPVGSGHNLSRAVLVTATNYNDCRWVQSVSGLTPGATYWITGWIKGEAIVPEPGRNVGANLCLEGTWTRSIDGLIGTFDWRQVSFGFEAPTSGTIDVGCRLGFWSNTASGRAWFDDLRLVAAADFLLDEPQLHANGHPGFLLVARPGLNYQLERSTNLLDWDEVRTVRPNHPVTAMEDTNPPAGTARFYRAAR